MQCRLIIEDLSRRLQFIDPFLQAAGSKNARLINSAIVSLHRLVVIKGLPRARLQDVLEAFSAATSSSLDIQLKILQALPALVQNYTEDLKGSLIASALYVTAVLQNVKVPTVSAVAAATLQQLVVSVFDRVAAEDAAAKQSAVPVVQTIELDDHSVGVREAAFDAYRILQDLLLASEGKRTDFLGLPNFSQSLGLDLIYAALDTHAAVFLSHSELVQLLKDRLAPALIRLLSDKQSFALSLRGMRLLPMLIQRHTKQMPEECEIILGLLTHLLDPESSPAWKRTMVMEVLRSLYAAPGLLVQLYILYDSQEGRKAIVRDNISTFVRLSTEKPALIGLGAQSTAPVHPTIEEEGSIDTSSAMEGTGGFASVMNSHNTTESDVPGLSAQWSILKVPILQLLDKTDPPILPETYIYSLALECINSLADNLAKVILPLTMAPETTVKRKTRQAALVSEEGAGNDDRPSSESSPTRPRRAQSYRSSTVPINPLKMEQSASLSKVKAIAAMIDNCWPALLATSSTFLYSALDNDHYRGLIRSIQKFTQVAGLLELFTARDAFLTTLGKAAVPPNLISSLSFSVPPSPVTKTPSFMRSSSILSVGSTLQGNDNFLARRSTNEPSKPELTTRNMLCLRALINLAIALGPTLRASFTIILATLQQADLYLDHVRQSNSSNAIAALGQEVEAVAAATKRLLESTADFPNESFGHVLDSFCRSLESDITENATRMSTDSERPQSSSEQSHRLVGIAAVHSDSPLHLQDRYIILSKLGLLTDLNIARFAAYAPQASGWERLMECLIDVSSKGFFPRDLALDAADIGYRACVGLVRTGTKDPSGNAESVHGLALESLRRLIHSAVDVEGRFSSSNIAVFCRGLEAIRAILESAGESLTVGWDVILESLDLAFVSEEVQSSRKPGNMTPRSLGHVRSLHNIETGRVAFTIAQLICADFLRSLSPASVTSVVDILHDFARQHADLNISLTAITLFSEVSAFLLRDSTKDSLGDMASSMLDVSTDEVCQHLRQTGQTSRPAQWMTLLYQLSEVASDDRAEIRDTAFQMLLRIIMEPNLDRCAFELTFESVLLKCLKDNVNQQNTLRTGRPSSQEGEIATLDAASKAILEGMAMYVVNNIDVFKSMPNFERTWERVMSAMKDLLVLGSYVAAQAVYAGLATILSSLAEFNEHWRGPVSQIGSLWSAAIPKSLSIPNMQRGQQEAFLAYIDCGIELVRLAAKDMTSAQVQSLSSNAISCVLTSDPEKYGSDDMRMTPLQVKALDLLKRLPLSTDGAVAVLVEAAAVLVRSPFGRDDGSKQDRSKTPTLVAISKAAMNWLVELVKSHSKDPSLYSSNSIAVALEALVIPIKMKYDWPVPGKPPAPWVMATTSALEIVPPIVTFAHSGASGLDERSSSRLWAALVVTATSVVTGDYSSLPTEEKYDHVRAIEEDEQTDAASFLSLRSVILPLLGEPRLSSDLRDQYCAALFKASVIHSLHPVRLRSSPLEEIDVLRSPCVDHVDPSRREDIAYLCLAELISMSGVQTESFDWPPSSSFSDPYIPGDYGDAASDTKRNLASVAAPWLVARFALSLKAYVADQPLRGAGRMPISMVEELVWLLQRMTALKCFEGAMGSVAKGSAAHINVLHPLLIKAVGVAGHPRHGDGQILKALMQVLDVRN